MTLKTLEQIETYHGEYDKIRDVVIKWIKEEIQICNSQQGIINMSIPRWMERFNLKEEDLNG